MSLAVGRVATIGAMEAADLEEAYRLCGEVARAHYENFPVVSRLLPRQSRRALAAVYAFARQADDFADEAYGPGGPAPEARLAALGDWEDRLREACSAAPVRASRILDPLHARAVFSALTDTIRRHDLPPALFFDLLSAFRQDVVVTGYETREALLEYCRRSANPVGRIFLAVHGPLDERTERWSDAICTGLQLANFWQDIAIDRAKGRVYLPHEDCRKFGVSPEDLDAPTASPSLRALLLEEVSWTRGFLEKGRPLLDAVPPSLRLHLRLVWHGGGRILEMIGECGGDVLARRPELKRMDWARVLLRAVVPWRR